MKAALICSHQPNIEMVFGKERIERIGKMCELADHVCTAADVDSGALKDVEVLFSTWGMIDFTPEQMAKLPNLKAVFYAAGATDGFCEPLFRRKVRLFSAWQANAIPVMEFALAQILLGLKNYFASAQAYRTLKDYGKARALGGPGAYGPRVALLGSGAISKKLQEMLRQFHVDVVVVPSRKENRTISIEEAFATSQVVSNHFPDRDDNAGVFTGKMFESMLPNAVFINTGRGRQVREDELIAAMEKRPDLTALLDVTFPEPPAPDSKLFTTPNIHVTPHIAGSMNTELYRMTDYMIEEFQRYLNGEPAKWEVSPDMLLTSKK